MGFDHSSPTKGFTLIEVLLVVVFLTILAAVAIPNFSQSYAQLQVRDITNDIAYLMRYAQSRAISLRRPLQLVFDEQRTSYWLTQGSIVEDDEAAEAEPGSAGQQRVEGRWGKTFKVPEDVVLNSENSSILFTPDGRIEKTQINVCRKGKEKCLIISTQNQSGYVLVGEGE